MLKLNGQIGWRGSNSSFEENGKDGFQSNSINRYKEGLELQTKRKYFYYLKETMKTVGYEIPNIWSFENLGSRFYPISNPIEFSKSKLSVKSKLKIKRILNIK